MAIITNIEVQDATYIDGYRLSVLFSDGHSKIVDFSEFLAHTHKAVLSKFKVTDNFRQFKIEDGNIVWGKNWDLIFPVSELYEGKIKN